MVAKTTTAKSDPGTQAQAGPSPEDLRSAYQIHTLVHMLYAQVSAAQACPWAMTGNPYPMSWTYATPPVTGPGPFGVYGVPPMAVGGPGMPQMPGSGYPHLPGYPMGWGRCPTG